MEANAYIKYLRISSKKLKPVAQSIVGLHPQDAIDRLLLEGNKAERLLSGVIKSVYANAKNNLHLHSELLRIKEVKVMKGPFFKRWQAVSRGIAHHIQKKTTHVEIILSENEIKGERDPETSSG